MKTQNKYQTGIRSNTIRAYRYKHQLRQTDLALIMGFEITDRLSHWERGSACPGLINMIKLCVLFNVQPQELYPELYAQIIQEIEERKINLLLG